MTDNNSAKGDGAGLPRRMPFPVARLFYAFAFALIAGFVVNLIFALAVVQFGVLALTGRLNDELKDFSFSLVQYLRELLSFVIFVADDMPFPLGNFPKAT